MARSQAPPLLHYALAPLYVALATLVHVSPAGPFLHPTGLFVLAVVAAGWFGGPGPGSSRHSASRGAARRAGPSPPAWRPGLAPARWPAGAGPWGGGRRAARGRRRCGARSSATRW